MIELTHARTLQNSISYIYKSKLFLHDCSKFTTVTSTPMYGTVMLLAGRLLSSLRTLARSPLVQYWLVLVLVFLELVVVYTPY